MSKATDLPIPHACSTDIGEHNLKPCPMLSISQDTESRRGRRRCHGRELRSIVDTAFLLTERSGL